MMAAVHAEWTKLRTVPSTGWLVLALATFTVAVGGVVVLTTHARFCPPDGCDADLTKLSLSGVYLGQIAAVVLGVLAVTNEHATGMIRTTLAANPHRLAVYAARAIAVTATVIAGGLLGVAGSLAVARPVLIGNGFSAAKGYPPLSLADQPTLRAAAGTVLYLGLVALLGLGVGAAVRDTAGALTTVLGLLYLSPIFVMFVGDPVWRERIQRVTPMPAGLAVQATKGLADLPIGPWTGLGVLAAYAASALLAGAALFRVRDA
jgi:hypothetical protein